MLHLKVLSLVQRVRRCVKFPVETSLQENHLCNASPPSRVEEKRWGPKNTFPETNKQLAIVGTVSTWKLMIFGVHMKFPFVLTIIRQFFHFLQIRRTTRPPAGYFLDSVCDQIFEIDWNGETFTHPGSWETFLKRRAERSWKYKLSWWFLERDEGWWKLVKVG